MAFRSVGNGFVQDISETVDRGGSGGVSVVVELVQYVTGLGFAELDDVISNGLGV